MPLPRTRKVRPFGVPAGIFTVTGAPRCDGTLMSAPSAASGTVTGAETVRLPPDRPNTGWGVTCTRTYRSPAGPPRSPGAPLPRSLIRWPSATPAGIRAWMVRVLAAWPLPLHEVHGSWKAKLPRFRLDCPVPSQVGQTLGTVPALAPVPWQTGQGPSPVSLSGTVVPSTASPNDSVVSVSTSAPRRGRAWVPARPPPPNIPPRMSPRPPLPALPPAVPPPPPDRAPRSNPNPPPVSPGRPPAPGARNPPNIERASSYSLRFFSSDRMSWASEISLKRSSASRSPLLASGWYLRASLRYDDLISSAFAVLGTPRTL